MTTSSFYCIYSGCRAAVLILVPWGWKEHYSSTVEECASPTLWIFVYCGSHGDFFTSQCVKALSTRPDSPAQTLHMKLLGFHEICFISKCRYKIFFAVDSVLHFIVWKKNAFCKVLWPKWKNGKWGRQRVKAGHSLTLPALPLCVFECVIPWLCLAR